MRTVWPPHNSAAIAASLLTIGIFGGIGCGAGSGTYSPSIGGAVRNAPVPSFSIALSPPSATVAQGSTATYTVTITAINGFSGPVTPSVGGLPAGATGQFSSNSVTPTASGTTTTLTVATTASGDSATPLGTSTITVSGAAAGITQSSTAQLTVQAPGSLLGTIQ